MKWSARDWRQFIAIIFLALANLPLSVAFFWAQYTVHFDPTNDFAFWLGIAAASLIGIDIIGLSAILGRRTFRFRVGDNEMEATGENAEQLMERAE
jgi:uncharacterized membrane protein YdbT with pleckstrin-like domain